MIAFTFVISQTKENAQSECYRLISLWEACPRGCKSTLTTHTLISAHLHRKPLQDISSAALKTSCVSGCLFIWCMWTEGGGNKTIQSLGASGENLWIPGIGNSLRNQEPLKFPPNNKVCTAKIKGEWGWRGKAKQNTSPWFREAGAPNTNNIISSIICRV
jgi:hypothetical protein